MNSKTKLRISRGAQREFTAVCEAYFPNWDKQRQWKVRFFHFGFSADFHGLCNNKIKVIFVRKNAENLDAVLIHEICHALNPQTTHGERWQNRMLKAATLAERKGDSRIANLLRKEIESYRNGLPTDCPIARVARQRSHGEIHCAAIRALKKSFSRSRPSRPPLVALRYA